MENVKNNNASSKDRSRDIVQTLDTAGGVDVGTANAPVTPAPTGGQAGGKARSDSEKAARANLGSEVPEPQAATPQADQGPTKVVPYVAPVGPSLANPTNAGFEAPTGASLQWTGPQDTALIRARAAEAGAQALPNPIAVGEEEAGSEPEARFMADLESKVSQKRADPRALEIVRMARARGVRPEDAYRALMEMNPSEQQLAMATGKEGTGWQPQQAQVGGSAVLRGPQTFMRELSRRAAQTGGLTQPAGAFQQDPYGYLAPADPASMIMRDMPTLA
jgi:hypothetical protein